MLNEAKHLWLICLSEFQRLEILLPRLRDHNDKDGCVSFFRVANWVFQFGFTKTFEP